MSFKVYNGFKLTELNNTTLEHAYYYCLSIRKEYNNMADNIWISGILNYAVAKYDDFCISGKRESTDSFITQAYSLFCDQERDSIKTKRYSFTNVGMQLCLAPSGHNFNVGIAFIDNPEMHKHFFSRKDIDDFHYQNQSDEPEGMTTEEWDFRKKVWESIFDDTKFNFTPAQCMFTIDIVQVGDRYRIYDKLKTNLSKHCPSYKKRFEGALRNYVIENETKNWLQPVTHTEYLKFIKSEQFDAQLKDKKNINFVKKQLKKDIMFDDLRKDM